MNLITRFKQTCSKLNPDLDLALNECDDNAFLDPITEAHWQGYQMANRWLPIEDAPKDGTRFFAIYDDRDGIYKTHYDIDRYAKNPKPYWGGELEAIWGTRFARKTVPAQWMPHPIPPLTTKGGE